MGASRTRKQGALIAALLSCAGLLGIGVLLVFGVTNASRVWPPAAVCAAVLAASAAYVFGQGTLPTAKGVVAVVQHVAAVRNKGVADGRESFKGRLRYYLPADWRSERIGREGWLIRPRGLGAPVSITIWAFAADAPTGENRIGGLAPAAEDLGRRLGFTPAAGSSCPRDIAGQQAICFDLSRRGQACARGFLWSYEGGDYAIVVETSSPEHLRVIQPAIEEFVRGLFMW